MTHPDTDRKPVGKRAAGGAAAIGALALAVLLGVVGLFVVYSGAYNVAATEEHVSFVRWAFDTTFQNSVERRATEVAAPETLTAAMISAGAGSYKSMCQHCHGAPGAERAGWASGMRPLPPHLTEAAAHWKIEEVFWLVRHGAKMTGMPAFGPTHDDQTLWSIAAFIKELPGMTPERYAELGSAGSAETGSGGAQ